MACSFIIIAKGHQKKDKVCGKPETLGGFCGDHQPKPIVVAVTPVTCSWAPCTESTGKVNAKFRKKCDEIQDRISTVVGNGIHPGGATFKGKGGSHQMLHDTQPHANSAFFYRWNGTVLTVYGVGNHTTDNKHYSLTWYDGSSAAVELDGKTIT